LTETANSATYSIEEKIGMQRIGSLVEVEMPTTSGRVNGDIHSRQNSGTRRLLDVEDVAEWLGVSKGWVRDHASGRRQPRLIAIKLGTPNGKGLWKFREEDVQQFILEQRRR
jgi:predicted DNA-binding transcriptional regulator AlpA